MAKANTLLAILALICFPFQYGKGSFVTVHTQTGCNATLLCEQSGDVKWIKTGNSEEIKGPRFVARKYSFFSTLSIVDASKDDAGSITCVARGANVTIKLEVCHDINPTAQCQSSISSLARCLTSNFLRNNCRKSCKLCPEPNCTETILPTTAPPITTEPPTTTEPSTTTEIRTNSTKNDSCGGVNLTPGFYDLLLFAFSLFGVMSLMF